MIHTESQITWNALRRLGFRFISGHVDPKPHMLCSMNSRMDVGLEISPCPGSNKWIVWLRSDIAHSKCRFCYVRDVETTHQLVALMRAISGEITTDEQFDEAQFALNLAFEEQDCKRRFQEYCQHERWGRIPGGL